MKENLKWQEGRVVNPFKIPEGYFESFEDKMMSTIAQDSIVRKNFTITRSMVKWVSGVAAVLLIGLIGIQQLYIKPEKKALEQEAMYSVIEYFAQELEEDFFAEIMVEAEVIVFDDYYSEDSEVIEWLDIDDMTIVDAMIEMAN